MHKWYQSAAGGPIDPCWDCGMAYDVANFGTQCPGPSPSAPVPFMHFIASAGTCTICGATGGNKLRGTRCPGPPAQPVAASVAHAWGPSGVSGGNKCITCSVCGYVCLTTVPSPPCPGPPPLFLNQPSHSVTMTGFDSDPEPIPVPKSTWKHGYCAQCLAELCPAIDGDNARACAKCDRAWPGVFAGWVR